MARQVSVRDAGNNYRIFALVNNRMTRIGAFSKATLSFSMEPSVALTPALKAEVTSKVSALESLYRAQSGVMLVSLMEQLLDFQKSIGVNGPGEAGPLFEDLEDALRTTLKKVQRMNDLAVRREAH